MVNYIQEFFGDQQILNRVKDRLPHLFQMAEIESSRGGNVGMQVGSLRESIIVALLIYKFGEENVETEIPITEHEVDVKIFGHPLSIKTITGKLIGVKLIWTVDAQKTQEFYDHYKPTCDLLLVQINWGHISPFYLIPLGAQQRIFGELGREGYIKLPKEGTNPRGIEITKEAL